MNDPYQLLGVPRTASAAEVKQAYRKLAKKLHPDMQQGKTGNEQRFKDVTAAYDLLSDPDKRARFDRGEIDASGPSVHRPGSAGARRRSAAAARQAVPAAPAPAARASISSSRTTSSPTCSAAAGARPRRRPMPTARISGSACGSRSWRR